MSTADEIGADRHYREQLAQGNFLIQRCKDCDRAVFQPRMICPHCGHAELSWERPSGHGVVYSTTIVRRRAEQGGDYNVVLVDLDEGVRMMSRVEGLAPEEVRIGMAVKADIVDGNEGKNVIFRPGGANQ